MGNQETNGMLFWAGVIFIILGILSLVGCDNHQPSVQQQAKEEKKEEQAPAPAQQPVVQQQQSGGVLDHMASAAAAGAAAGSAGAVAHNLTNRAMDKFSSRKAKPVSPPKPKVTVRPRVQSRTYRAPSRSYSMAPRGRR